MGQTRLNWCMLLHVHNDETDELDLKQIASEFVARNSSRQNIFGNFMYIIHVFCFTLRNTKFMFLSSYSYLETTTVNRRPNSVSVIREHKFILKRSKH